MYLHGPFATMFPPTSQDHKSSFTMVSYRQVPIAATFLPAVGYEISIRIYLGKFQLMGQM